ncbi:MAG: amidohydrolase [Thermotaleaceae bacterium]
MENKVIAFIQNIEEKIIAYRRDFHKFPEVGWTEFRTASIIARRLTDLGYKVQVGKEVLKDEERMGLPSEEELTFHYNRALEQDGDSEFMEALKGGFTGVVGSLDLGVGPVIALRFDIDALKIAESQEKEHIPFKLGFSSVNENIMHSCGHDAHAAIGLGVAETLAAVRDEIKGAGKIKLIFQPAEEGVRGAKAMVAAGVLDDVDYVIGGHIMAAVPSGTLICGDNGFMATTKFDVTFKGLAAHAGGAPNEGKNAMLAACTAVLNLNAIPRHREGFSRINVGLLQSGTDRNIIPEDTFMKVETRGQTTKVNEYIREYAVRVIENSAKMHEVDYAINYVGAAMGAICSQELVRRVKSIGEDLNSFDQIIEVSDEASGSEDFTYMINKVQQNGGEGVYFLVGTDYKAGHHNTRFDINEKDLIKMVKLFTMLTLDILEKDNTLRA